MRKIVNELGCFFADKINRVVVCTLLFGITILGVNIYMINNINASKIEVLEAVKKAEKKVDFRYFNLTNSLSDIHHVKIDTLHGRLEK